MGWVVKLSAGWPGCGGHHWIWLLMRLRSGAMFVGVLAQGCSLYLWLLYAISLQHVAPLPALVGWQVCRWVCTRLLQPSCPCRPNVAVARCSVQPAAGKSVPGATISLWRAAGSGSMSW